MGLLRRPLYPVFSSPSPAAPEVTSERARAQRPPFPAVTFSLRHSLPPFLLPGRGGGGFEVAAAGPSMPELVPSAGPEAGRRPGGRSDADGGGPVNVMVEYNQNDSVGHSSLLCTEQIQQ